MASYQIQQLVATFKEQLVSAIELEAEERGQERIRPRALGMLMGRRRGKTRNGVSQNVRAKLSKLMEVANDVLMDLEPRQLSPLDSLNEGNTMTTIESHNSGQVYLVGPPGTEFRTGIPLTNAEDDYEPLVHQRNSANITLNRFVAVASEKLHQIPMKDSPRSNCEVFLELPDDSGGRVRYTRAQERAYLQRINYCEVSSESELEDDSESEYQYCYSPTTECVRSHNNKVPAATSTPAPPTSKLSGSTAAVTYTDDSITTEAISGTTTEAISGTSLLESTSVHDETNSLYQTAPETFTQSAPKTNGDNHFAPIQTTPLSSDPSSSLQSVTVDQNIDCMDIADHGCDNSLASCPSVLLKNRADNSKLQSTSTPDESKKNCIDLNLQKPVMPNSSEIEPEFSSDETPPQEPFEVIQPLPAPRQTANIVSPKPSGLKVVLNDLNESFSGKKQRATLVLTKTKELKSSNHNKDTQQHMVTGYPQITRTPVLRLERLLVRQVMSVDEELRPQENAIEENKKSIIMELENIPTEESIEICSEEEGMTGEHKAELDGHQAERDRDEDRTNDARVRDRDRNVLKQKNHKKRPSPSSWSEYEEEILSRSNSGQMMDNEVASPVPDLSNENIDDLFEGTPKSISGDRSSLSPNFLSSKPPKTAPSRKSQQSQYNSSSYNDSLNEAVRTPPLKKIAQQRRLFNLVDSEDEFDMTCSPCFSNKKKKNVTLKRRKILKSLSDDENNTGKESKAPHEVKIKTESLSFPSSSKSHSIDAQSDQEDSHNGQEDSHIQNVINAKANEIVNKVESSGKDISRQELPSKIPCSACGKKISWRKRALQRHPRLDVLVCDKCFHMITSGEFTVSEGHEVYCTLCGDGSDIMVMCDFCIRSFCGPCIERVSGEDHLNRLLNNKDVKFKCYSCDPLPIQSSINQQLYLAEQNSRNKNKPAMRTRSKKNQESVDTSREELATEAAIKSEREPDLKPKKEPNLKLKREPDLFNENVPPSKSSETKLQLSWSQRKKNGSTHSSTISVASNELSGSMSDADSSNIDTDDISDSSIFSSGRKKKENNRKRQRGSETDPEQPRAAGRETKDKASTNTRKRFSKKRHWLTQLHSSDFEYESESPNSVKSLTSKPMKKRALSLSSSTEGPTHTRTKKSRLAERLSSSEDSDCEKKADKKLSLSVSDNASDDVCFIPTTPDRLPFRPPTYLTPRSKIQISSDSSEEDTPVIKSERKPNKKRRLNIPSSHSISVDSSPEPGGIEGNFRTVGSDNDFTDLSRVGPKLKKKGIKRLLLSESELSDSESVEAKKNESENSRTEKSPEKQLTPGKKRKEIRKLIDDSKLNEETKLAAQRESERLNRLKRRKKTIEDTPEGEQLVLEEDPATKTTKVAVRALITKSLKPHQKAGIKFLYDACVESLERFKSGQRNGAILAHCMGLGKTLQLLSFIDALLCCEESKVKRVIILSPINTLYNWINEIERWLPDRDYGVFVMHNLPTIASRLKRFGRWFNYGGIMLIGYDMFRNLALGKNLRKKKSREELQKYLLDPGGDIVVCDEGHVMRNSKSNLSVVLGRVKTMCRIVLTGTPLQNNLMEYYTMVNFVKPNLLGTQAEFRNQFVNPIKNGQCSDSKPSDIRKMRLRAHVLHTKVEGCVQRKDFRVLSAALPAKHEYVIAFRLTEVQDKLYRLYLDKFRGRVIGKDLFSTFSSLAKVWNHPWVLRLSKERENFQRGENKSVDDEGSSLDGFIVYSSDEEVVQRKKAKNKKPRERALSSDPSSRSSREPLFHGESKEQIIISSSDMEEPVPKDTPSEGNRAPLIKTEPGTADDQSEVIKSVTAIAAINQTKAPPNTAVVGATPSVCAEAENRAETMNSYHHWYDSLLTDDIEHRIEASGKLLFLMELLKQAEQRKEKVIVFSQSLLTLDIIERFLVEEGSDWTPGLDYYRLDGSTKADQRQSNMNAFNESNNYRIRLFLISTRAGSLGVNLVAANRVVIFDACWNPSHDLQAIFRTYRFGQTKPVFVYRLLAQGTMEEKIYDRQVTKESLSMRVVDHKQIGRHYTASDLAELFAYSPKPPTNPPYKRPIDDALGSILDKLEPQYISGYHEHDSLLEHIFDEELTEAEKEAAWESYKKEKAAETKKYNFDALQKRMEEETQMQSSQTHPTVLKSLPSTSQQGVPLQGYRLSMEPFHNANTLLNAAIKSYSNLLEIQRKLTASKLKHQVAATNALVVHHKILEKKSESILLLTNQAIIAFNRSPQAQNPGMNQTIREKRTLLDQLFKHVKNSATLLPTVYSNSAVGSSGQSSLASSENTVSSTS